MNKIPNRQAICEVFDGQRQKRIKILWCFAAIPEDPLLMTPFADTYPGAVY